MTVWGTNQEMNELEATMWRGEAHPTHSTQGGVLMILESSPGWEAVEHVHRFALKHFRRFRQRVVEPAIPVGPPVWADDENFDLGYHLRRTSLPPDGDLLELCQTLAVTPLDRNRALWNSTFIEGLEGGKAAYFLTIHHCLMDGHASIQLLTALFEPEGQEFALFEAGSGSAPSGFSLAARQAFGRVKGVPGFAAKALSTATDAVISGPRKNLDFAASAARVLAPPPEGGSELMKAGSRARWRYGTLECGLNELKAVGKKAGGTLNDAYVAAILGGLRHYHEQVGATVGDITLNIPVSVRREDDPEGGNRFAVAFITGPMSIADPVERIQALRATVSKVKGEPALDFFSYLLPALNRAPAALLTPVFTSMQERADLTISNVPGMRKPVHFMGSEVERVYYFGPLAGASVMSVLCSHNGTCCIGINCDGDVFDDPPLLHASLQAGLDEVLAL